MKRTTIISVLLLCAAVFASGCGGPDIESSETCLKALKLRVERSAKGDKEVIDGVSALSDPEDKELLVALAANVENDTKVKEFQARNKDLTTGLSDQKSSEFQFDSGSDGTYVWAVAGSKDSEKFSQARDCVKP